MQERLYVCEKISVFCNNNINEKALKVLNQRDSVEVSFSPTFTNIIQFCDFLMDDKWIISTIACTPENISLNLRRLEGIHTFILWTRQGNIYII
jgi:hypothetical protein